MRTALILILALLLAVFFPSASSALDPDKMLSQYVHDAWQTEQGLPQNTIQSILQTRDGYLWLATQEGLARFDGKQFVTFSRNSVAEIKNNLITSLLEDREGRLWFSTGGGGLNSLKDGKFSVYTSKDGLSDDTIFSICEDREGAIWIGTRNNGLNRFKDGQVTSYTTQNGLSGDSVVAVYADREGALWIGVRGGGLNHFHDGQFKIYTTKDGLSDNNVSAICEDGGGGLWIGTNKGLNRFKDGRFIAYTMRDGLSDDSILTLQPDRKGALWIGTRKGGLNRFYQGRFNVYSTADGLSDYSVLSLYEDREENLWVGTVGGGLNRFKDGVFTAYTSREGLADDEVSPIFESREGSLWLGTSSGLTRIKDKRLTTYTPQNGFPEGGVFSICEDRAGSIWVGIGNGSLGRFKDERFTFYTKRDGLPGHNITALCEDADGAIWVGTYGGGAGRFKDGRLTRFTTKEGLSHNTVLCLIEDREKNLWMGTRGGGLNRFRDGQLSSYTTNEGLSNDFVYSLYEDQEGTLWIGTSGGGLNRFKNGQFTSYTMREGLFDNVVFSIVEDNQQNLWMSCNKGVYRASKKELNDYAAGAIASITSTAYSTPDGMKNRECNGGFQPAGWKTQEGKLWFPTIKGAVCLDPDKKNLLPPPVYIEGVTVNQQSVSGDNAEAPPGKGDLEFHYTALSLLNPDKVMFRFKLEGYDENWVDAGSRRVAYYTKVSPGRYRFRVIACNDDGVWNETGAAFNFYLKPYFYQTWWFYLLTVVFMAGVVLAAHRFRIRHLKERERKLELLVAERTRELEQANESLHNLAILDGLTNIANHRRFREFLDHEWRRSLRQATPLSLVMMDIDYFKKYNDDCGHQAGDDCLKQVAEALQGAVARPTDLVARYGGEEFVAVLADTDRAGAMDVAEKMRQRIEALNLAHPEFQRITISAGVASIVPVSGAPDDLIGAADEALYRAKRSGRNQVCFADAA